MSELQRPLQLYYMGTAYGESQEGFPILWNQPQANCRGEADGTF